jgi:hypothetical protein
MAYNIGIRNRTRIGKCEDNVEEENQNEKKSSREDN